MVLTLQNQLSAHAYKLYHALNVYELRPYVTNDRNGDCILNRFQRLRPRVQNSNTTLYIMTERKALIDEEYNQNKVTNIRELTERMYLCY